MNVKKSIQMERKEAYDVLRFIEHNQICHISTDVVDGYPLVQWLRNHPYIEKELLFRWIDSLVEQLSCLYRCRGKLVYQYVNPYSLILSEERNLHFLDLNAQSNETYRLKMQKRVVRELFLPPDNQYYQNACEELDIYGLGRTIQFLLSASEPEPRLSRFEDVKFRKVIERCVNRDSRKAFDHISEIRTVLPQYQEEQADKRTKKRYVYLTLALGITLLAGRELLTQGKETERLQETRAVSEVEISEKKEEKSAATKQTVEEKELYEELGLLHFVKFQDYPRSQEYFEHIENDAMAELMVQLTACMSEEKSEASTVREILEKMEPLIDAARKEYYPCLFLGYDSLPVEQVQDELLRIGKLCMEMELEEELSEQIQRKMATVYEEKEAYEDAVTQYAELLTEEKEETEREQLYLKLGELLEASKKQEEAMQILRTGIQEIKHSVTLRIFYLQMQCRDQSVNREAWIQLANEQLEECSDMEEAEEFLKLLKEQGLKMKGGIVCEK